MRPTTMSLLVLALCACRGQTAEDPPIVPIRNMYDQPKYEMQQAGEFFEDNRADAASGRRDHLA